MTLPVITVLGQQLSDRPPFLERLEGRAEVRITDTAGLESALDGAQVLLLWDALSPAVRAAWGGCQSLTWIHVTAAGVDSLLFPELSASGVVVTNARGIFDRPIAEYVLGAMLAHAKRIHYGAGLQRENRWQHYESRSLRGARVAILGTGAIGRECARVLTSMGMQVRGFGRSARDGDTDFGSILCSAELADHVNDVDYLVIVAPLTDQTVGIVNSSVLAALPKHAHLINVGRGECVVTADLVAALRAGELDGASLDVVDPEPLPRESPLWTLPGVHITPHMSGDAEGCLDSLALQFLDNCNRWLAGQPLNNVVDTSLGFVANNVTAEFKPGFYR